MAEENGAGRSDRIEAILERVAERQRDFVSIQERDHEEFTRDHRQLMTWQVLMQEKMAAILRSATATASASTGSRKKRTNVSLSLSRPLVS
jgi:hypothetical protein